jgi:hypothetical protein
MANNCVAYSCYVIFAFLGFWTFFSIVGAIHYAVWYSHFDLADVHIRTFNVTPELELSYDMDIMIAARHFSSIRRIEQYSYEIRTSHVGMRIGASSVPGFHPGGNKTLEITTTQNATRLPMGDLGALVAQDLNATGRVARLHRGAGLHAALPRAEEPPRVDVRPHRQPRQTLRLPDLRPQVLRRLQLPSNVFKWRVGLLLPQISKLLPTSAFQHPFHNQHLRVIAQGAHFFSCHIQAILGRYSGDIR